MAVLSLHQEKGKVTANNVQQNQSTQEKLICMLFNFYGRLENKI